MKTKKNEPGCLQSGGRCVAWRMLLAVMLLVAGVANAFASDEVHAVINGVPYVLYPDHGTANFDYDYDGECGKNMLFVRYVSCYVNGKPVKFDAGNEVTELGSYPDFKNVESVTIGDGIEKIASSVFAYWEGLKSVSFKSSDLKTIGESAFEKCEYLQKVLYYGEDTTSEPLTFGSQCFLGCTSLTTVTVPSNRPYAFSGTKQFYGCTSLTSFSLPKGLQKNSDGLMLPSGMLGKCSNLADLAISDHVSQAEMAADAFQVSQLTTFSMPFSVTYDATAINGDSVSVSDKALNVRINLKDNTAQLLGASDPESGIFYVPDAFTIVDDYKAMGLPTSCRLTGLGDNCLRTNMANSVVMPKSMPIKVPFGITEARNNATQAPLAKNCFNPGVKNGWTDPYAKEPILATIFFYTEDGTHFMYRQWFQYGYPKCDLRYADDGKGNYGWETKTQQIENVVVPHAIYLSNLPLDYWEKTDEWPMNQINPLLNGIDDGCYDNNLYVKNIKFVDSDDEMYNLTIGKAFNNCPGLTEVILPRRVNGVSGFNNCDNLKKVTILKFNKELTVGFDAFKACQNLEELSIKRPLELSDCAFIDCPSIKEFHAEAGVTSIGIHAFKNCTSLRSIKIENTLGYTGFTLDKINGGAFENSPNLTEAEFVLPVNTVCKNAFASCPNLATLRFNQHVGKIEANFMDSNVGIKTLYFGQDITTIDERAFAECPNLSSVTFTGAVGTVGDNAFYKESTLSSVSFGSTLDLIGQNAFSNCKALTDLTFGGAVGKVGFRAFERCEGLTSLTLAMNADKEAELDQYAFNACSNLRYVILRDCRKIGGVAFWQCGKLVSAQLGDSLTSLGDDAFSAAPVASLVLPKSLTTIEGYLGGAMKAVVLLSNQLDSASIGYLNRSLAEGAKVYCPGENFSDYKNKYAAGLTKATLVPMAGYKYCNVKKEDARLVSCFYNKSVDYVDCYNVKNFYGPKSLKENSCVMWVADLKTMEERWTRYPFIAELGDDPSRLMVFAKSVTYDLASVNHQRWLYGVSDTDEGYYEVGDYILQSDNKFHRVGKADTFKKMPNTAYIPKAEMDNIDALSAPLRLDIVEEDPTGIDTLPANDGTDTEGLPMYNLAGQRITAPAKGQIYIQGGAKYMKK